MAGVFLRLPSEIHSSLASSFITVFIFIVVSLSAAASAEIKSLRTNGFPGNDFSSGNSSLWHHCPDGWTLYGNMCYKLTQAVLKWAQADVVCKSLSGNLVKISSQCEQDWMSQFVKEQLGDVSATVSDNRADVTGTSVWIGFVWLPGNIFQWSDGQLGEEKGGFWAVDGLHLSQADPASKLCCDMKATSADSKQLQWYLSSCEELHPSICQLPACEENSIFCEDRTKCVSKTWLCDGSMDCSDGSDEKNCETGSSISSAASITQSCGDVYKDAGAFHSPNFPDSYSSFLNCLWKLQAEPPKVIQIRVSTFDIEKKYDSLKIYDSTAVSAAHLLVSLDGSGSDMTILSTSSMVTLLFVTDHSVEASGFNITWKSVLPKTCIEEVLASDTESQLVFPHSEEQNSVIVGLKHLTCEWVITAQSGQGLVSLQFRNVTLLKDDYIVVFDGKDSAAAVLTHITSVHGAQTPSAQPDFSSLAVSASLTIPPVITSSGQHLLVRVVTSKGSSSSFVALYKKGCDTVISVSSSLILSPGFPTSLYPNDLKCSWRIQGDDAGRRLTLLFLPHFHTEPGKDLVQVYSSETAESTFLQLEQSGSRPYQDKRISSLQGFFINFVSDSTINHGRWAAVISYDCDALTVLYPLMLNNTSTEFGSTVGFSCPEGFSLDGPTNVVCGTGGQWLPFMIPACKEINCGPVPISSNAHLTLVNGTFYGSVAKYQCFFGHNMIGSNTAKCTAHGWTNPPSCLVVTCPKEPPPYGGIAQAEELIYGYQRQYFCEATRHLVGSKFSHCDLSGNWTDQVPRCEVMHCPAIYGVLNGQVSTTQPVAVGTTIEIHCNKGFVSSGASELICMPTMKFNHPVPTCVDIDECKMQENCGSHVCQNYFGGFHCYCQQGYQHSNNSIHLCEDTDECEDNNGGCSHECVNLPGGFICHCPSDLTLYTGPFDQIGNVTIISGKTCIETCQPLNITGNMKVLYQNKALSTGELLTGTVAVLKCPLGSYPRDGAMTVSCMAGKGWSSSATDCIEHQCPIPNSIWNGYLSYTGLKLGDCVRYVCDSDSVLQDGPQQRFCIAHIDHTSGVVVQRWSGPEPRCAAVICPAPRSPSNGRVDFISTKFNSVAVYRCYCGFEILGSSFARCQANGKWSHAPPVCKAKFCRHPGVPADAAMVSYKTGFPVWSVVKYDCQKKGYQLSDPNPLQCLPQKESKKSVLLPYKDVAIMLQLTPTTNAKLPTACIQSLDISETLRLWSREIIQSCEELADVRTEQQIISTVNERTVNITAHFQMSSNSAEVICNCSGRLETYIQSLNSMRQSNETLMSISDNCPSVQLVPGSVYVINDQWKCFAGQRLEIQESQECDPSSTLICWEDCIEDNITPPSFREVLPGDDKSNLLLAATVAPESLTTLTTQIIITEQTTSRVHQPSPLSTFATPTAATTNVASSSFGGKTSEPYYSSTISSVMSSSSTSPSSSSSETPASYQTDNFETSSTFPTSTPITFFTPTIISDSRTVMPPAKKSTASSPVEPSSPTTTQKTSISSTVGPSKAPTTQRPIPAVSTPTSPWVSSYQPLQPMSKHQPTTEITTAMSVMQNDLAFNQTYSPTNPVISSAIPKHRRPEEDAFWSEGHDRSEIFRDPGAFSVPDKVSKQTLNCTAVKQQHNNNGNLHNTLLNGTGNHGLNISDCLTTHTLEKQEITVVQGSSMPSIDLTAPAFALEIHDRMSGGFRNISCIDAIHVNINGKVNALLREFGNNMGSVVCSDAPDSSLELAAGNIRFKGTQARIFIKFLITYSTSSKSSVETCAREFQGYVSIQLPKKFERVQREVQTSDCTYVNYTRKDFNVTLLGWTCRSEYEFDEHQFQCFHTTKGSFPTASPVLTVPHLSMVFVGAFTSSQSPHRQNVVCKDEYRRGLMKALSDIEPYLQSKYFLCKDIYLDVAKNVTVNFSNRRIVAQATVHLLPLKEKVNFTSLSTCSKFISLHFREPSQHLPTVTLSEEYLAICPSITLTPHGLRSNIGGLHFYCPANHVISDENFKCVQENLPVYATGIKVEVTGTFEGAACIQDIHSSAHQMIVDVISGIRENLKSLTLCDHMKDTYVLHKNGDVIVEKQNITILIPVRLVSFHGSKTESINCTKQIYHHLSSSLSSPISTMINDISAKCGGPVIFPENYTVNYTRWECLNQLVYNPLTHMCGSHSTQAFSESKGLNSSTRSKRNVASISQPQWNASLPTCADHDPPQFYGCPENPVELKVGPLGPRPQNITLPTALDSSGIEPKITVYPTNFTEPFLFDKNMTIEIQATDAAGNIASCIISVVVIDDIPPHISCPAQLVTIIDQTAEEYLAVNYNNIGITATDNNAIVNVTYDPPEGSIVRATDIILVTAKAMDADNNIAKCSFFATVKSADCMPWSLPNPMGGNRTCTYAADNRQGLSCSVSCDKGKGFAIQPPEVYVCQNTWQPHDRVPQCVDGRFPDYELHLKFELLYIGDVAHKCPKEVQKAAESVVQSKILEVCQIASQDLTISEVQSIGIFSQGAQNKLTTTMKITIESRPSNPSVTKTAQWCGNLALSQLHFNETVVGSCGQTTLNTPNRMWGRDFCPQGFTFVDDMCYQCPPGTHWVQPTCQQCPMNITPDDVEYPACVDGFGMSECPEGQHKTKPQCVECPKGTYQNTAGGVQCINCSPGFTTYDTGTQQENECRAPCAKNTYSATGLEPCLPCPITYHQNKYGSTMCDLCPMLRGGMIDRDTNDESHNLNENDDSESPGCQALCNRGHFSVTGLKPCQPCPHNYYNPYWGATSCIECPGTSMTRQKGSINLRQCVDIDLCKGNSCRPRGLCTQMGRNVKCQCPSGFKGNMCQERVHVCDSQPCKNSGTCEKHGHSFQCRCLPGFSGSQCGIKNTVPEVVDHCASSPCFFGDCLSKSTDYLCLCHEGYEGSRCDVNIDNCTDVTCQNNGVCIDLTNDFFCSCVDDFYGKYCEHSNDDCQVNYCLNGGTCEDGIKAFSCLCPPGFRGDLCEEDIDECLRDPCQNGGLCQDGMNNFKCLCAPGYTGINCQSLLDMCSPNPCLHEGRCLQAGNLQTDYICACREGYTGKRCEQIMDMCSPMPCNMSGSLECEGNATSFKCSCLPGWKGPLCEQQKDPCESQPCNNGATCVKNGEAFMCVCTEPYTGPTCSDVHQHCLSQPCLNKGTCIENIKSFSCQCAPGFTGHQCEVNLDECRSKPCLNGGVCQDGVNAFICKCQSGFAGEHCQIDIDECKSYPCLHNSTCIQMNGDFRCNCNVGYTGKQCEIEINDCKPDPCQHGGQCIDKLAGFECICSQDYIGVTCEQPAVKCADASVCLNGGSCQRIDNVDICICLPYFTGPDCGKEKSSNFDLNFHGEQGLVRIPSRRLLNTSEISLCLWVKFSQPDSKSTYLSLSMGNRRNQLLSLSGSHAISPLFTSNEIVLETSDGQWHHQCWMLGPSVWYVYIDGKPFMEGKVKQWTIESSFILGLGQDTHIYNNDDYDDKSDNDDDDFKGQLHSVNIYSYVLDGEEILNMSQHCQTDQFGGDIFDWVLADSYVSGDVSIVKPSQCGQSTCSENGQGSVCGFVEDADRLPPVVTQCPDTIVETSQETLVPVMWDEPEFTDNVGITLVKQNFRPGQVFPHGQFLVTYLAYDSNNNSAECSFSLYVRKFDCVDPAPPANGARVCGEWEHGRYCIPSCTSKYRSVTPLPPFYRCGQEGIWSPSNGEPFRFPACARAYPPAHTIYGGISFEGPGCTDTFLLQLRQKLVRIMIQLNNVLHLCNLQQECDYTKGIIVDCGEDDQLRKRREVEHAQSVYSVKMNITVGDTQSTGLAGVDAIPDTIVHAIKYDQAEKEFSLTAYDLHLTSHCQTGQMLTGADDPVCLACPAGHYLSSTSMCYSCPRGWYNDKPQQTTCLPCNDSFTTYAEGAKSVTECAAICESGEYFDTNKKVCEKCPSGQYQDEKGQSNCLPCPVGMSTLQSGATSRDDCYDPCKAGEEIGPAGTCNPCPMGTYSSSDTAEIFCTPCPHGWTTDRLGAVDLSQCNIEKCKKGYYHDLEEQSCHLCPLGTFQSISGTTSCEPCGVGLTTEQEGADSALMCVPGKVDECELKIASCEPNTHCVDLDDGYTCECIYGKSKTGQCIGRCDIYCNKLRSCNNNLVEDKEINIDCHCEMEICRDDASSDKLYQTLIIACITVASIVTLLLLVIIALVIHRKKKEQRKTEHVRIYRNEREFVAFTNEAFDSLATRTESERDGQFQQMPSKMATRWHSQSFMSTFATHDDDTESTEL